MNYKNDFKKLQSRSKSKLELDSNLDEILPVNCKFIQANLPFFSAHYIFNAKRQAYKKYYLTIESFLDFDR